MAYLDSLTIEDDGTVPPLALLRLTEDGIRFCWLPELFLSGALDDSLRSKIVTQLRFQADRLEAKDCDRKMREVMTE